MVITVVTTSARKPWWQSDPPDRQGRGGLLLLMPCKPLLSIKEWAVSVYRLWKPSTDPRLPVELERIIFEFAAYSDRRKIPTLMCVAPRVKEW